MSKQITYILFSFVLLVLFFRASSSLSHSDGAPAGYSGSPGDNNTTCMSCHGPNLQQFETPYSLTLDSDIYEYYVPNELYYFSLNVNAIGFDKFGFQLCFENEQGEKVGQLLLVDSIQTQLISDARYITHTNNGVNSIDAKSWDFYWRAPIDLDGDISVYASVLISNNSIVGLDDYVLSTGSAHTVREFVEIAFKELDIIIEWSGEGVSEVGIDTKTGKTVIMIDSNYFRPTEVDVLIGDSSKARSQLGWESKTTLRDTIKLMVSSDLKKIKKRGY
mgnify:CR=1 FL=1